jgi:MFS family permease
LIIASPYSGAEQGFIWGDFTTYYVKPALGLNNIGFVMAFFGATDALASYGIGKLSDKLGRTAVMSIG